MFTVIPHENRPRIYKYLAQHAGLDADLVQFETLYVALDNAWNVIKLSRAAVEESLRIASEARARR